MLFHTPARVFSEKTWSGLLARLCMQEMAFAHVDSGFNLNHHHHLTISVVLKAFIEPTPIPPADLLMKILSQDNQCIL